MEAFRTITPALWVALGTVAVASIIFAILKMWRLAYRSSKTAAYGVMGVLIADVIVTLFFVFNAIPSPENVDSKATALARGISEIKSEAALAFSVMLFVVPVWEVSRKKSPPRTRRGKQA